MKLHIGVFAGAIWMFGCVESNAVVCPNGSICPDATSCAEVTIAGVPTNFCVQPGQLEACNGVANELACNGRPGSCHDGVCLPDVCGNQLRDATEVCDDGPNNGQPMVGGCSSDCQSNQTCRNGTVDVLLGETCDAADAISHDGCSSTCGAELVRWDPMHGRRPIDRSGAALAYDAKRRRIVLFGGAHPVAGEADDLADTFTWDGLRWSADTGISPPSRSGQAMTFDAAHGEIVMFSGGTNASDTWTWNGSWVLRHPEAMSSVPPARRDGGFVYDSGRGTAVLFGGSKYDEYFDFADTWRWDGNAWTEITPASSPTARSRFAMGYDPKRGVIVLFGGYKNFTTLVAELWEFDGTTWTQRLFSGGPGPRAFARLTFDPMTDKMMLVGGLNGVVQTRDTWEWNGTTWNQLVDAPTGVGQPAVATDPLRKRVVLLANDEQLYEWTGVQWSQPVSIGAIGAPTPPPRGNAAVATDPLRHRLVMFGGVTEPTFGFPFSPTELSDTWVFDGSWRVIAPPGPAARYGAAIAYDEERKEVVMFGGCYYDEGNVLNTAIDNQTWVWAGDHWTQRTPSTPPPPLCFSTMAWDRTRKQLVLFGGRDDTSTLVNDTYTWNGTNWHKESPATRPPERFRAAMGADPVHENVVLFGGQRPDSTSYADTWLWNGQDWVSPATSLTGPAGRRATELAWDAARRRLVMVGGEIFSYFQTDLYYDDSVWEWDGATWTLQPIHGVGERAGHNVAPGIDGAGIFVFGGFMTAGAVADLWRLRWDSAAATETCVDVDADGDALAGCADPDCWSWCTPHCPPGSSCPTPLHLCGDGICDVSLESCTSCAADCGACPSACGNFACDPSESSASCPGDCS